MNNLLIIAFNVYLPPSMKKQSGMKKSKHDKQNTHSVLHILVFIMYKSSHIYYAFASSVMSYTAISGYNLFKILEMYNKLSGVKFVNSYQFQNMMVRSSEYFGHVLKFV